MATITACDPKRRDLADQVGGDGRRVDGNFIGPASKMPAASASVLMPPPTMKGMNSRLRAADGLDQRRPLLRRWP